MAKVNTKVIKKPVVRQKVLVTQGGKAGTDEPLVTIYEEKVDSKEIAVQRVKELSKEYEDKKNICISFFSI